MKHILLPTLDYQNISPMIVNNFRLVSIYNDPPPSLNLFVQLDDLDIYHSLFNENIYVVHDLISGIYHALENNGDSEDIMNDLKYAILAFIRKT